MQKSTLEMAVVGNPLVAIDEGRPTNLKAKIFGIYPSKVLSGDCVDYIHLMQWRSKLDNSGGHIFIYSSSQTMKTIDFKRN